MTLPPIAQLDRTATFNEVGRLIAEGQPQAAASLLGRNPMAVFGWLVTDGLLACSIQHDPQRQHAFGALAVLFRRWVDSYQPGDERERAAAACFESQLGYLAAGFARLQALDDEGRARARTAHQLMTRAAINRDAGATAPALELFAEAEAAWLAVGEPALVGQVAADRAALLERDGELEEALERLQVAVAVAEQSGDLERLGRRLLHRGKLALQLGRVESALADYRRAQGVFRVTAEHGELATALLAEGEVLALQQDEGAGAVLELARTTAAGLDDQELVHLIDGLLARLTA